MATKKPDNPTDDITKIIRALQDLYRSNSDILNALDLLSENINMLNSHFKHLKDFENQVFKNFLKNKDKPKENPYDKKPFGY